MYFEEISIVYQHAKSQAVATEAILNFNGVFETFSGGGENEDPTKIFPDLESPSFFFYLDLIRFAVPINRTHSGTIVIFTKIL